MADYLTCKNCDKIIAEFNDDKMKPSFIECYKNGAVPVPNMGWLCSQECCIEFEKKYDVKLGRTVEGKVDYYYGEFD